MSGYWWFGFMFTGGALSVIGICVATAMAFQFLAPTDETDGAGARSQMALRVDHGTGCQYLESSRGSLTPRMGRDGKQVCKGGV